MTNVLGLFAPPSETPGNPRVRLAFRIGVFLIVLGIQGSAAYNRYTPDRWLYADGSFYYNIVKGLVQHGSLDQSHIHPRTWFNGTLGWNYNLTDDWSNISVGRDNTTWYPKHAWLMPLFSVPFYLAFGVVGTLLFNVLCGCLSALLMAELAARFTARWAASLLAIGLSCMPAIVRQAYGYNNDVFYTVLVLATAVELADRRWARAGLWGGLSVLAKITNVIFLVPFGLLALATRDLKVILRFVAFSAIGIGIAALANWIMFGAPWTTSYDRVLIVHNGADEIQSHFRLFSRVFDQGLHMIWAQLRQTLPAYPVAFLGCAAMAVRKRFVEALVYALVLLFPLLLFAKYSWYREEFMDPSYALCAAPLGALLGLAFAPVKPGVEPAVAPRSWGRGIAVAAALLVVIGLGRGGLALADHNLTLAKLVPDSNVTHVFLDDVPCDYFNNGVARWECSGFDRGQEWAFTGQTLDRFPHFNGVEKAPIDLNPNPSDKVRRMVFEPEWRSKLVFGYGIPDGAVRAGVTLTVKLGDTELLHEEVVNPGWTEQTFATPKGTRTPLEVTVTGPATPAREFFIDGTLLD